MIFSLPLRALQSFINSIFKLLTVPLASPLATPVSVNAQKQFRSDTAINPEGATHHIVIDSTSLKAFGEGEWKVKKHGAKKSRTLRKRRLAIDLDTYYAISAEVNLVNVGDSEVLPTLLNPLLTRIIAVSSDGAYDTQNKYLDQWARDLQHDKSIKKAHKARYA